MRLLHVAQIGFHSDSAKRRPAELLEAWRSLVDVAEATSSAPDVGVSVIQACAHEEQLTRNGVQYHFLPFGHKASTSRGRAAFHELIRRLAPDVFHVHGLGFPRQVLDLAASAPATAILIQDHASQPPRIWRRPLWRRGLAAAAGVVFCAREQAWPFEQLRLIQAPTPVYEVPESTSRFNVGDQAEARRASALEGEPCLLWVGHLNDNKDPLTVLDGVSEAARHLPGLQLWCCFGTAPLLSEVRERIAGDPRLANKVHLLGRLPHKQIEILMRAADLFVLGSHREGSGYSVIEALACGLPPIVTDIPSFRVLTGNGSVGALWPCGDAQSLSQAIVRLAAQPRMKLRVAARSRFEEELSFAAVGRKLAGVYRDLADRRQGRGVRHE